MSVIEYRGTHFDVKVAHVALLSVADREDNFLLRRNPADHKFPSARGKLEPISNEYQDGGDPFSTVVDEINRLGIGLPINPKLGVSFRNIDHYPSEERGSTDDEAFEKGEFRDTRRVILCSTLNAREASELVLPEGYSWFAYSDLEGDLSSQLRRKFFLEAFKEHRDWISEGLTEASIGVQRPAQSNVLKPDQLDHYLITNRWGYRPG